MSRAKRVVAKGEDPGHGYVARRSQSKMEGQRFGKLVVGDLVKLPCDYLCKCDCGRTVVIRTATIGLRLKRGLPVDCGQCEEHPKYVRPPAPPKARKRLASAADSGGKKESYDIPYTPTPPCEVGGLCEHFARCRNEQIACLDYVRYEINGSNERTGAEPNKYNLGITREKEN